MLNCGRTAGLVGEEQRLLSDSLKSCSPKLWVRPAGSNSLEFESDSLIEETVENEHQNTANNRKHNNQMRTTNSVELESYYSQTVW